MRRLWTSPRLAALVLALWASRAAGLCQESASVFDFLDLPASSHAAALGGRNVSLVEDDISLAAHNPALLSGVSDRSLGLDFMSYMKGSKAGGAAYSQLAGSRGAWMARAQFLGHGAVEETLATGERLGEFRPLDLCLGGGYSYVLTDRLAGGAAGKLVYSHYGEFTSCALAVDLGLNYFDEEADFSLSAVARNMGGQVKTFADRREKLPFDLEVGFTKGLGHAPVTVSLTMADLTRWSRDSYLSTEGRVKGGTMFMSHFALGVDVRPSRSVYVCAGFNFRRAYEMKAAGSSHAAGLSFGAGANLRRVKVGLAYAKYHVGAPALSLSLSYNFRGTAL